MDQNAVTILMAQFREALRRNEAEHQYLTNIISGFEGLAQLQDSPLPLPSSLTVAAQAPAPSSPTPAPPAHRYPPLRLKDAILEILRGSPNEGLTTMAILERARLRPSGRGLPAVGTGRVPPRGRSRGAARAAPAARLQAAEAARDDERAKSWWDKLRGR